MTDHQRKIPTFNDVMKKPTQARGVPTFEDIMGDEPPKKKDISEPSLEPPPTSLKIGQFGAKALGSDGQSTETKPTTEIVEEKPVDKQDIFEGMKIQAAKSTPATPKAPIFKQDIKPEEVTVTVGANKFKISPNRLPEGYDKTIEGARRYAQEKSMELLYNPQDAIKDVAKINELSKLDNNAATVSQTDLGRINGILGTEAEEASPELLASLRARKQQLRSSLQQTTPEKPIDAMKVNAELRDLDKYITKTANALQAEVGGEGDVNVLGADVRSDLRAAATGIKGTIGNYLSRLGKEAETSEFATGVESLKLTNPNEYNILTDRIAEGKPISSVKMAQLTNKGAQIIDARNLEQLETGAIDLDEYSQKQQKVNQVLENNFYKRPDILQKSVAEVIAKHYEKDGGVVVGKWFVSDNEIDAVPEEEFAAAGIDPNRPEVKAALKNIKKNEGVLPFDNAIQKDDLLREVGKGFLQPLKGTANLIGNIGASDNEKRLQRELEPVANYAAKRGEYFDKHYGGIADAFNGLGQFVSQYLLMEGSIGAIKGLGLATGGAEAAVSGLRGGNKIGNYVIDKSQLWGQLAVPFIQSYDDYYKSALEKTDNPTAAKAAAFINASVEAFSEKIFNNVKFGREVISNFRNAPENLTKIAKIFDKGVWDGAAAKQLRETVEDGIRKAMKTVGKGVGDLAKESFEEVPVAFSNFVTDALLNPKSVEGRELLPEMKDAFLSGMVNFSIPSVLGTGSRLAKQFRNKNSEDDALMIAAKNRDSVAEAIQNQFDDGELDQDEVNYKMKVLNESSAALKGLPETYANGQPMSEYDRSRYLGLTVQERLLQTQNEKFDPDDPVAKTNEARIKEILEQKSAILSPEIENGNRGTPEDQQLEQKDAQLLAKITSRPEVGGLEESQDLQYFIDKVGEAPIAAARKFGEEAVNELLPRVDDKTLEENYKFVAKLNPESPEALAIDAELTRREEAAATIESAVIEIGGKTYEGKNHAEAILKAKEAGEDISQVDRQKEGKFKLSDGSVIDRAETKTRFGQDRSELLIEQDDAADQANADYKKITESEAAPKSEPSTESKKEPSTIPEQGGEKVGGIPKAVDEKSIAESQQWLGNLFSLPDYSRIKDKDGNVYEVANNKLSKLILNDNGKVIDKERLYNNRRNEDGSYRSSQSTPDFFRDGYEILKPESNVKEATIGRDVFKLSSEKIKGTDYSESESSMAALQEGVAYPYKTIEEKYDTILNGVANNVLEGKMALDDAVDLANKHWQPNIEGKENLLSVSGIELPSEITKSDIERFIKENSTEQPIAVKEQTNTGKENNDEKQIRVKDELVKKGLTDKAAGGVAELLVKALEDKDAAHKLLHPDNKNSRELWSKETGMSLPKTVGGTKDAIDAYFIIKDGGLKPFEEIVNNSNSAKEAFDEVKKLTNVSKEVAKAFSVKYDPKKSLTPEQAFKKFYNEVKAKNETNVNEQPQNENKKPDTKSNESKPSEESSTPKSQPDKNSGATEKAKSLAEKIRALKIQSPGLQSNFAGVPIAMYNITIKGLSRLAEAKGINIREVVRDFYNWVKTGAAKFKNLLKDYAKILIATTVFATSPQVTQNEGVNMTKESVSRGDKKTITDLAKEYYAVNEEEVPQEVIDRALYLWNVFGRPKVNINKDDRPFADKDDFSITVRNFEDFVDEIGHIAQFVSGAQADVGEYATQEEFDAKEYDRKGSQEFDAHKIIAPMLANYIFNGKTGSDLIQSTSFDNDTIAKDAVNAISKYLPSVQVGSTYKLRGKEIADLLRKGKIKSQGLQSNIAGIPITLWNAAVETVALAIEGGATLAKAIRQAIKDHNLGQEKTFDKKTFVKSLEDATGEKFEKDKFENKPKAILNRIYDSEKVSDSFKEKFKSDPKELRYDPQSHETARKLASEIVDEFGTEDAISMAESGRFDGDVNSMIFAESIDRTYQQEQEATNQKDKIKFAEQWADYAIRYDETARQKGKFISAIYDFYKKSPLGVVLSERAKRDEAFKEWFVKREDGYKEVFEAIKDEPEFKEFVKEKVNEGLKEERKTVRQKRRNKIIEIFDKGKIQGGNLSSSLIPPQIWNAAVEIMKQAYLVGDSIVDVIEQGVNYIKTNYKQAWDEKSFNDEWTDRLSAIEGNKIKADDEKLKQKQERVLNRFRKKLSGLSDQQKEDVIRRSFKKLVENGALEYEEFKKIIADVLGLGEMTAEEITRLNQMLTDINSVQDAADNVMSQTKPEDIRNAIKNFDVTAKKAERSATRLAGMLYNKPNVGQRMRSMIQLNTLGIFSLIKNIGYNVFNQIFVRIPKAIYGTAIDQAIYGLSFLSNKVFGSPIIKPDVNILLAQKGYFSKGAEGGGQALKQIFTGLTNKDYFQKEVYTSQIKPWTSIKDLWNWGKGNKYLSKAQIADKALQATVGIPAEIIARGLNVGDKPFRFASEGAVATTIGKQQFGLSGAELDRFIKFPKESATAIFKSQGQSDENATKKAEAIEKRIISEGEQAVFQQENIINEVLNKLKNALQPNDDSNPLAPAGAQLARLFGVLNLPYVKTPVNIMWEFFNLMNPEIALFQSFVYGIKAAKSGSREDFIKSKKWLSHAATGYSILAATAYIASIGALGGDDDDEPYKAKEARGKSTFEKPHTINLSKLQRAGVGGSTESEDGDLLVDLSWWGPLGSVMNYQANKYENMTEKEREDMSYIDDLFGRLQTGAKDGLVNTTFRGAFDAINAITSGRTDNWIINMMNVGMNLVEPATIAQMSRANRKYEYQIKGDTFSEKLRNNIKARFFGKVTPKVNIWGDNIEKGDPYSSMLGVSKYRGDVVGQQIHKDFKRTGDDSFYPPATKSTISVNGDDKKLNTEQQLKFETLIGNSRKTLVEPFLNYKYGTMNNDDEKKAELKKLYDQGYYIGKAKFVELYPEFKTIKKQK